MAIRDTLVLTRSEVKKLLDMEATLAAVETAFLAHGHGEARMPSKIYLDLPEYQGDFRAMPAYLPALKSAGMKWVSSYTANPAKGLPAVIAVFILSDPETAEPLAIMDATYITLMRTGAAGGIAAKHLALPDAKIAALIGAGAQSHTQLDALLTVRAIDTVRIYDPHTALVQALAAEFPGRGVTFETAASVEEAVEGAHVIVTTTPSHTPVVKHAWVADGAHINAIGADAPGKQELDAETLCAARVFVDDVEQASHSGEVNVPLTTGTFRPEQIAGTLGAVLAGKVPGRISPKDITVFDSTGLALQDLATARAVYDRALAEGLGVAIPFER